MGATIRQRYRHRILKLLLAAFLGISLAFWGGQFKMGIGVQPVSAQSLRPESISELVYQRFPDFPKENQYTRQETGELDLDNTLVTRLIRYHQDVKKRLPRFRLDWKLTLADYLGVNEPIKAERYPGHSTLSVNPMENDIQAIRTLDRRQRAALVDFWQISINHKRQRLLLLTLPVNLRLLSVPRLLLFLNLETLNY